LIAADCPKLSSDALTHFKKLPNLADLELHNGAPLTDSDMTDIGSFTSLTKLWLPPGVGDATLTEVAKLPILRELFVSNSRVTDAGLASLKAMKRLTSLTIPKKASVTDAGIANLQKALPNLKISRE